MRLQTYIKIVLVLSCLCFVNNPIIAQNDALSSTLIKDKDERKNLSFEQETLANILSELERLYQVEFSYSPDLIPLQKTFSFRATSITLSEVLQNLFKSTTIEFRFLAGQVVLYTTKRKNRKSFTISGYFTDAQSGEKLIGAHIYNLYNEGSIFKGGVSNVYGFYSLTLPFQQVNLSASYIGYQGQQFNFLLSKDTVLNIVLNPSIELTPIVVVAKAKKKTPIAEGNESKRKNEEEEELGIQLSAIELNSSIIKSLPAMAGEVDVLRSLQLFPGVQSGSEGTTGLYIRGGGPDQNLILLDGVPVYHTAHLSGLFSVFNADAIRYMRLIKGGFPARYGGRLSSVLDIRLKEGNMKKMSGDFNIGFLTSKLTLQGPLVKDKTSFILSGRYTYLDAIIRPISRIILGSNNERVRSIGLIGYFFYDFSAKINHKFSDKDRLYLSFFRGLDKGRTRFRQIYKQIDPETGLKEKLEVSRQSWGNTIGVLRWNHVFGPKLFSNTSLAFNEYRLGIEERLSYIQQIDNEEFERDERSLFTSGIQDFSLKTDMEHTPQPNHKLRFGTGVILHRFNAGLNLFSKKDEQTEEDTARFYGADKLRALEISAYMEDETKIGEKWVVNAGLYTSIFRVKGRTYSSIEPRLSARCHWHKKWTTDLYLVNMTQYLHLLSNNSGIGRPTDIWVSPTEAIGPQRSWQFGLGVENRLSDSFSWSIEGYMKQMNDVISYQDGISYRDIDEDWQDKVAVGKGYTYGGELLLRKDSPKFSGWLGYTLAKSVRQFDEINNGEVFPYRYDRRHDVKLTLVWRVSKKVSFSTTWVYATGNVVTLPLVQYMVNFPGNVETVLAHYQERNNFRMPNYHRLDFGVNFQKKKKRGTRVINISVYNLYNRNNPYGASIEYESYPEERGYVEQQGFLPMLPSISYRFSFEAKEKGITRTQKTE